MRRVGRHARALPRADALGGVLWRLYLVVGVGDEGIDTRFVLLLSLPLIGLLLRPLVIGALGALAPCLLLRLLRQLVEQWGAFSHGSLEPLDEGGEIPALSVEPTPAEELLHGLHG